MKRIFLICTTCLLIFNSCKKDKDGSNNTDTTVKIDATGTYALTSVTNGSIVSSVSATYTSALTPCVANNKMILKSDGTSGTAYSGNDSCYVIKAAHSSLIIGIKGDYTTSKWSQKGNRITLNVMAPYVRTSYGDISNVDGKVQIVFKDTIKSINSVSTSILTKE